MYVCISLASVVTVIIRSIILSGLDKNNIAEIYLLEGEITALT